LLFYCYLSLSTKFMLFRCICSTVWLCESTYLLTSIIALCADSCILIASSILCYYVEDWIKYIREQRSHFCNVDGGSCIVSPKRIMGMFNNKNYKECILIAILKAVFSGKPLILSAEITVPAMPHRPYILSPSVLETG